MSTEWHFHAFDAASLAQHVLEPLRAAATKSDAPAWRSTLVSLASVFPPAELSSHRLYPKDKPITALRWYKGQPDLDPDTPPTLPSESFRALCWALVWAISPLRIVSRELRPGSRFRELTGLVEPRSQKEEAEYSCVNEEVFEYQAEIPAPFDFLQSRDASSSFVPAASVAKVASAISDGGYLRRASIRLRKSESRLASDFEALSHFLPLAASQGLAVHYYEPST